MSAIAVGEITIIDLHDEDVHIGTTAPVDLKDGRLWLDTSTVPNVMKRWDAATQKWVKASPTEASDIGAETPSGAQDKADGARDAAKTYAGDILKDLADGKYANGSFIDETKITSPTVISPNVVGLQGTFADLLAGNPFGARLELGEDAGTPFLEAYDSGNKLRVRLLQDRLEFMDTLARRGGLLTAVRYTVSGDVPMLLLEGTNYTYMGVSPGIQSGLTGNNLVFGGVAGQMVGNLPTAALMAVCTDANRGWRYSTITVKENIVIQTMLGGKLIIDVDEGVQLPNPGGSAYNPQIDFTGGYALYRDDAGAGGDNTRLWLNTPSGGEVIIGPRSGSYWLGQLRIRSERILLDPNAASNYRICIDRSGTYQGNTRPTIRPSADTVGFLGTSTYRFYQGFASGGWLTSSEKRLKTNIEMANKEQCYDQVKALKFKTYNFTSESERAKTEGPDFKVTDYIGVIAEESPDIICDVEKKNINLYPYISLIGAAVQEVQARLEALESERKGKRD